ncbi:MAG: prefoldin subunit alpha [Thermoplasmata archaeon]|nr:prefoldin subunit alpha [Thermoplasmata archaeon]
MNAGRAPVTEQQVQEELVRLDAYRSQLNAMVQQYQYLSSSRTDHLRARESLEGLDRVGEEPEILIPVGGDAFLRGRPMKDAPVLLGIGAGVVVEMERPKVSEILAQRLLKIEQASHELEGQIRTLEDRIQVLSQRLDSVTRGEESDGDPAAGDVGRN